jgi:hypothetical protein
MVHKRQTDQMWLRNYKEHVDDVAAIIMSNSWGFSGQTPDDGDKIAIAVKYARALIDEVDRQVDSELEHSQYKAEYAGVMATCFYCKEKYPVTQIHQCKGANTEDGVE